ncbi:beta-ketoacyl-[acyl-carrier-protein] synthase family protein [Candidatus Omnitrophota bacterium]
MISSIGIVAASGVGKEEFWSGLERGEDYLAELNLIPDADFPVKMAAEVKELDAKGFLGPKGLRNLDRSALFLLIAAQQAIQEAGLQIDQNNCENIGVCTGTTFSHLWSIFAFDQEVSDQGVELANPALFPSNVMNAASSHVSIRYNIQGFNATISTGCASSIAALDYSVNALETKRAEVALAGAVETLNLPLLLGFHKLGYMAGLKGQLLNCPFDRRRNGPVFGEAAVMFCVEDSRRAQERNVRPLARIRSVINIMNPFGQGLEQAIKRALDQAGVGLDDIDYISSCANSSQDLDKTEVAALKGIFGNKLKKIPVSSIKSMLGETLSASAGLQVASCIGAMERGIIPPTINYREEDPECLIDCVPNKAQKKEVDLALVIASGLGGYSSACILEKYSEQKKER